MAVAGQNFQVWTKCSGHCPTSRARGEVFLAQAEQYVRIIELPLLRTGRWSRCKSLGKSDGRLERYSGSENFACPYGKRKRLRALRERFANYLARSGTL